MASETTKEIVDAFFKKHVLSYTYHDCEESNGSVERVKWIWYETDDRSLIVYHSPFGENEEDCKRLAYEQYRNYSLDYPDFKERIS